MKKNDTNTASSFFEYARPNAVVIIPIKKSEPVLIFKHLGVPFYRESNFGHNNRIAINDFKVYWKGKFLNHNLPVCIENGQRNFFNMLIENKFHTHHWWEDFPDDCIEMPISILMKYQIQLSGSSLLKDVKTILKKIDVLYERRGKNKNPSEFLLQRDVDLINIYIDLGSPRRLPIKEIKHQLKILGSKLYHTDDQKAYKYDLSDRQLRYSIKKFLNSKK